MADKQKSETIQLLIIWYWKDTLYITGKTFILKHAWNSDYSHLCLLFGSQI